MFEAWGRWVFRHRWLVLALSAVLFALSLVVALTGARLATADGHWVVAVVDLAEDFQTGTHDYPALREAVRARAAPLEATFTGDLALMADLDAQLERDLHQAEFFSAPAALVFLLLAFGTL